jgi:hypothetical protein
VAASAIIDAPPPDSLSRRMQAYANTGPINEAVYQDFTQLTDTMAFLKAHRDFVEQNAWGFGDRAFHYMWYLVLIDLAASFETVRALEIGVYKGQVLSLWALLARELGIEVEITGVSPFQGNLRSMSIVERKLRRLVDAEYRANIRYGNLYPEDDYLAKVHEIFGRFGLDADECRLVKGYSTDPLVIAALKNERYSVIYVDGDHSYEGAASDIRNFAPLVATGGYLVMDDASCFIPGDTFWKGRESVSKACELIAPMGFENVLNVGHDRIYRKHLNPARQSPILSIDR